MISYSIYNLLTNKSSYTVTFTKYWVNWTLKAFKFWHSYMLRYRLLTKWGPWYVKLLWPQTSLWLDGMGSPVTVPWVMHPCLSSGYCMDSYKYFGYSFWWHLNIITPVWNLTFSATLWKDFVILELYWWLFSSTKHCGWNMV